MRARRRLALAPVAAAALFSLQACEQLFPEHPFAPRASRSEPRAPGGPTRPGEHGDTPQKATRIVPGAPQSGTFESAEDVDYFQVEVTTESYLYVSIDQGKPQKEYTQISIRAEGHATWSEPDDHQSVRDPDPGTYYIRVEPRGGAGDEEQTTDTDYDLAVWLLGQENDTFDIQLRYVGDVMPTDSQREVFRQAAQFWQDALMENDLTTPAPMKSSADRCDDTPPHFGELVDDLLINIEIAPTDGLGHTLALGGYCIYRIRDNQPDLPVIAIVVFDAADIGMVEQEGWLYDLAVHEMAHALGFGMDLWRVRGYRHNPTIPVPDKGPVSPRPDTYFDGPRAREEFDLAGGTSYRGPKVPVENADEYGEGSVDSHWRKSVFEDEVMIASLGGKAPVSRITLGSLEDIGYAVNYEVADDYHLQQASVRSSLRAAPGVPAAVTAVPLANDLYPVPPRPLELPDELVEALRGL